ncbi:glycosyltransferase involved in cell wall biosynthesis [Sedimentibacter acidaminivorans]|jgi:glycosyltransferase involved in cell wall biosynthesis|uniref:Glycosyltransferase involved in cell wall biosynthesis n=1 Tax=Sedimentibacter acidaminivorans TaxID=913099 RepID=A0ABS4G9P7_9FIRM|nr:glycosyltransferase family 4 protein [Sedimentibacter acidaminivorans]MBP1924267.1 glycosyltransferase involved in cell wall biosynthesis [Sedimentibacter acidaminivorans]
MNVLFLTLLDFSTIDENGIYTDLMREFVKDGHDLFIISPTEKRKNEPTKLIDNSKVKILKLQIGNTQKTNLIEKGISTLTLESKFKSGIKKYFDDVKFDLVLYSTPPITLQKAVEFVKLRDQAKTYLLLKDIFPQNAVDLGILKTSGIKSLIYKYFRSKEERLYKISDYIGCMSNANVEFLLKNNLSIANEIVEVCPNSIEPINIDISEHEKTEIREKYNLPIDKTIFIYGGNLGKPQGIDFLIDCIRANEDNENSYFFIVGSGTEFGRLESFFEREKPKNAMLQNQLPRNDYELLANTCDVGLIFLDRKFTIPNFPSRLLSYMQASMPVLAATDINTDIGKVIESGSFGYWCESVDVDKFNHLVNKLCDEKLRISLGRNARYYLENHYKAKHSYEIIINHFNKEEGR